VESPETPFPPANPWRSINKVLGTPDNPEARSPSAAAIRQKAEEQPAQEDALLRAYFDQISQQLLTTNSGKDPSSSKESAEVRAWARAQTLTVLAGLKSPDSPDLRRNVVQFLYELGLITKENPIISLAEADLSGASLFFTELKDADLNNTVLKNADLTYADLRQANLRRADLSHAKLGGANLSHADLSGANLSGAEVTDEQLVACRSLAGATMPNGSIYS
jgi:hypothetical protein